MMMKGAQCRAEEGGNQKVFLTYVVARRVIQSKIFKAQFDVTLGTEFSGVVGKRLKFRSEEGKLVACLLYFMRSLPVQL